METLLVGIDGSEVARRAAERACELGSKLGARVRLAYVYTPLVPPADVPPGAWADANAQARRSGEKMVSELAGELRPRGCEVEGLVRVGSPAEELCALAEDGDVALVVVGRTGKGAVQRVFLGSAAGRLSHACPKPLLIVP